MESALPSTSLQQYTISDFLDWYREGRLILNPDFQRRSIWSPAAKTYLIDTILHQFPMPKFYIRTTIDPKSKKSVREVVDGQQRLTAIIDFAEKNFRLTPRSKIFSGTTYDRLDDNAKSNFLSYSLSVDQLINADDSAVLEVFARLNTYGEKLNAAEKRHADFQGEFRWLVIDITQKAKALWDELGILSIRQRLRMADYSLVAEMLGIVLDGVEDGGERQIRKLYEKYDKAIDRKSEALAVYDDALAYLLGDLREAIKGPLTGAPHFLMLFAAVAYCRKGIPHGALDVGDFPAKRPILTDKNVVFENLALLAAAIEDTEGTPERLHDFALASKTTTQRIASRRKRFTKYVEALTVPTL